MWDFSQTYFFSPVESNTKFPLYNLYTDESGSATLEIALAGYKKSDIEVLFDDILEIRTKDSYKPESSKDRNYVERGVAKRKFSLKFKKANYQVKSCSMDNGLLTIVLHVPKEDIEAKLIDIK